MIVTQMLYSLQRKLQCKEHYKNQKMKWASQNMGNYRLVFSEINSHLYENYFYWNESKLYKNIRREYPKSPIKADVFPNVARRRVHHRYQTN